MTEKAKVSGGCFSTELKLLSDFAVFFFPDNQTSAAKDRRHEKRTGKLEIYHHLFLVYFDLSLLS